MAFIDSRMVNGPDGKNVFDSLNDHASSLAENASHKLDWLNAIESKGAKTDGTDTTSALQNAINSANTIYLPDGTYVTGTLTIKNDLKIILSKNAILKLKNGANAPLISGGTVSNFTIEGGKLDGNKANNTGNNPLINIANGTNIKILVNQLDGGSYHGVLLNKGTNVEVNIGQVTNMLGSGVRLEDTSYSSVKVKKMDNIAGHGIVIAPMTQDCIDVKVNESTLTNVAQSTNYWGIYFNSGDVYIVRKSKIVNCLVDGSAYGGIFPCGDDNEVVSSDALNCTGWRGMWIHDSKNISVLGGKFNGNGRDGILVGKAHNVTLTSVHCEGNANHGINVEYDATATGRYQGAATNKTVKIVTPRCLNNSIGNSNVYSGIYLKSFVGVSVLGAVCTDTQGTKTQRRGIESDNLGSGHIIVGNDFTGNVNAGLISINDAINAEGNQGINNHVKFGSSAHPVPALGHSYLNQADNTFNIHNGSSFKTYQPITQGSTGNRPTGIGTGFHYFDTTLQKPVWYAGSSVWKDATGATV